MGTTSEKLTYLNGTKTALKDMINLSGAGITSETTFRNYATKLYDGYVEILKDKYTLLDAMPKGTGTGVNVSVQDAVDLPVYNLEMDKESTQETTTGKNKLAYPNLSSVTVGNITFTHNKGIYTISTNGTSTSPTSTSDYAVDNYTIQAGDYIHYYNSFIDSHIGFSLNFSDGTNFFNSFASSTNRIISLSNVVGKTITSINFIWNSGYTFNGTFSPMICNSSTVTDFEEYTGGQPSPNPDYPQEVNTVKGYRNLLNENEFELGSIDAQTGQNSSSNLEFRTQGYIEVKSNTTYNLSNQDYDTYTHRGIFEYDENYNYIKRTNDLVVSKSIGFTLTTTNQTKYVRVRYIVGSPIANVPSNMKIQLNEGAQDLPYVPYGNNYVAVNVSNGNTTNSYPIPLNNNEIVGIGEYKDELLVDKSGHVFINKKTGKVVLNGSENWNYENGRFLLNFYIDALNISGRQKVYSNYFEYIASGNADYGAFVYKASITNSQIYIYDKDYTTTNDFKNWLSTHNTDVYYVLETPQVIDLNTTIDVTLFEGTNNISNSEDANMQIRYVKSVEDLEVVTA